MQRNKKCQVKFDVEYAMESVHPLGDMYFTMQKMIIHQQRCCFSGHMVCLLDETSLDCLTIVVEIAEIMRIGPSRKLKVIRKILVLKRREKQYHPCQI